ncbi:MAG: SusD/RagB family nutrient-binding outer membrane lipoprotein [Chitinophagaceae bacterium]|nr:SusD/RagB family nutrient-binding outer membrane lipoprotein [Chitinophagaceae bacterium]MCW5928076.1 SusD/RagB family nutrient-binding outer membrane lipoprotein [Chitinophagaceae bacterium]
MKYINKINAAIIITIVCIAGCTKKFDEINTNPSLVSEDIVKIDGLFTNVLANSVTGTFGGRIAVMINYLAPGDGGFPFIKSDYSGFYNGMYTSFLINLQEVVRLSEGKPELSNKNAIARILSVWIWQNLTDRFGDVPFAQAALPVDQVVLQPKYDTQESIYRQLFADLKAATAQLSDASDKDSYGNADILFNGNVASWRRFANSLRFRMAIRVRYVDQALAQENISDVLNAPLIGDDSQSAKLLSEANATASLGYYNPIRGSIDNNYTNGLRFGFTAVELLHTQGDPRLPVYFNLSVLGSGWRGAPVNISGEQNQRYPTDSLSLIGDYFRVGQFRYNVITAAEVSFLKAEAVLFGLASGDAQSLFQEGIQNAMKIYGIDQNEINTFLASPAGTLTGTNEEKLKQIIEQKYLALLFQADEAWAEYRRTGYPLIWIGNGTNNTNGTIPRRLVYAFNEYLLNEDNVKEAAARLSDGDELTSRMWWDAKPGLPYQHPRQGQFPPETW